jgi:hexosaminidase
MKKNVVRFLRFILFLGLALLSGATCTGDSESAAPSVRGPAVIPKPVKMKLNSGSFVLKAETGILVDEGPQEVLDVGRYLSNCLGPATGLSLVVQRTSAAKPPAGSILLTTRNAEQGLGEEGYELTVTEDYVILRAPRAAGVFRGVQTIRQLLPPYVESRVKIRGTEWAIPCVEIVDKPRFPWRGSLLDSCRHFLSKDFVKRYIDLLAYHKMNRLHWHLCEDQGWCIEIKKYPRLTEIGAWRGEGKNRYGGFYTQEDVKEIVEYAKSRYIMVVPEIEMPGHCTAALTSYPELSCTGGPFEVSTKRGIHTEVYCAGNDKVFEFLEDVLSEVIELFPAPYIHIGGDECPKERWKKCPKCQARIKAEDLKNEDELQSYFIKRIEKFLLTRNRRLIGWDEILEGGLAPAATVQSWRGLDGAIAAARAGHDVIVSPTSHCYLDYPHNVTSLEKIYSFEPIPKQLTAQQAKHILGGEGNMWTDRTGQELVDSWVFPRLTALAEVLWSQKSSRDWKDFSGRMQEHYKRLNVMGVRFFTPIPTKRLARWQPKNIPATSKTFGWDITSHLDGLGSGRELFVIMVYDQGRNGVVIEGVKLIEDGKEIARDEREAFNGWPNVYTAYRLSSGYRRPEASYKMKIKLRGEGGTNSWGSVWLSRHPLPPDIR